MGNQTGKSQNQAHGGKPKKNVHWKSAERPSSPGRPILIALSDQQPDVITLKWERPKSDGGSPIIGYYVEHRRMGSPHWVKATPTLVTRCEVAISGLEPGWRYQFRTIAENVVGKSDPSELSDALTVTLQRNAITVPRFVLELSDINAVENERIELRVKFLGQPPPEINWFKDGFEIFSSRRTKIVNDNESSVLIIHQVAFTDEGEIKCTATNRAGHVVTRAKLKVEAPPKIRLPRNYEDGLIVEADEAVRLKVGIAGQPIPVIKWTHEGEQINSSGRYELETTDKNSLLRIDNVKRSDRGEYCIRAVNKLGEDTASFLVTVTSKPEPPGKVKLKMSFGKSATLTWTAPIDDGGCKIGNYIVEYFRIGWNVWLKAATTRQLTTTLNDLIEGSEYKFRVKAENPYGLSEPSEESDSLFVPDPKRGIHKSPMSSSDAVDNKPTPPRRKTLSPTRTDDQQQIEQKRVSPNRQAKVIPQLFENVDLHNEMSYGTPDAIVQNKREVRTSPVVSNKVDAESQVVARSPKSPVPKRSPVPEHKIDNQLNVDEKRILQKSPSPVRKPETPTKNLPESPKSERILEESQQRKSLSPIESVPLVVEEYQLSSLQRSQEPVTITENDLLFDNKFREKDDSNGRNKNGQNGRNGQNGKNETITKDAAIMTNPSIQISAPPSNIETHDTSDIEKRDEVHTSNEFMLVFYPNSKSKETNEKEESFELNLEDALAPPAISISSPDLHTLNLQYFQTIPMRRSVSSTELLYERAMARFYEAMELEEAGKSKSKSKLKTSHDYGLAQTQPVTTIRKRLGSMSETERLSFEKRSQHRRRSIDISQEFVLPKKWDSIENIGQFKSLSKTQTNLRLHKQDSDFSDDQIRGDVADYGSDYTESTAESSQDSIAKFKSELLARTKSNSSELETYHPRNMAAGVFTPYRAPTPDHSTIVLTKPVPLPDPNFVPKPILKRPSRENSVSKDELNGNNGKEPDKIKDKEKSKGIKSFFKRDKKSNSDKNLTIDQEDANAVPGAYSYKPNVEDIETKRKIREEEERKKREQQQMAQEEAKVVVDHYSDIVREVGTTRKYHSPLYLNSDELKRAAEKAALEGGDESDPEIIPKKMEAEIIARTTLKPRLSLVERQQVQHVQKTNSRMAMGLPTIGQHKFEESETELTQSPIPPSSPPPSIQQDNNNIRGRTKVIKVKKIIKKRVPSKTRSRDNSSSRPPSSIGSSIEMTIKTEALSPVQRRIASIANRQTDSGSISPGPFGRRQLRRDETPQGRHLQQLDLSSPSPQEIEANSLALVAVKTIEEITEEAQENVRSAFSYITDLGLFIVACYVYLFKDARLVLPILALMVYRQLGDAIRHRIPNWMKRKKS